MIDQNNIRDSIEKALSQGRSKEEIYKELLEAGNTLESIQEIFSQIESGEEKKDIHKRTVNIMVIFGAILIAAGIFSFIAANWQYLPKISKILIIIISMLAAYGTGWFLSEKKGYVKTGQALYLLGSIIYGSGIFLVGQMFHIRANWPDGFILWMIGVLVMAFAIDSFILFYLAIPLGVVAIFGHPFNIFENILFGFNNPFLMTSSILLIITVVVTFATGMVIKKRVPPEFSEYY